MIEQAELEKRCQARAGGALAETRSHGLKRHAAAVDAVPWSRHSMTRAIRSRRHSATHAPGCATSRGTSASSRPASRSRGRAAGRTLYVVRHGEVLLNRPGPGGSVTLGCVGPAARSASMVRLTAASAAVRPSPATDAAARTGRTTFGICASMRRSSRCASRGTRRGSTTPRLLWPRTVSSDAAPLLRVLLHRAERTAGADSGTCAAWRREAELSMLGRIRRCNSGSTAGCCSSMTSSRRRISRRSRAFSH